MTLLKNKEFRALLSLSLGVIFIGTIFYHYIEKLNWINSLYFSSMTLTTVGYGDIYPLTIAGKIFTIVYSITGIGILFTFINFWANERIKKIEKRIRKKRK